MPDWVYRLLDAFSLLAVIGLALGIFVGVQFLKAGYNLGRSHKTYPTVGWIMPVLMLGSVGFRPYWAYHPSGTPSPSSSSSQASPTPSSSQSVWSGLAMTGQLSSASFTPSPSSSGSTQSAEQAAARGDNNVDAIIFTVGHPNGSIKEATTSCDSVLVEVSGPAVDKLVSENDYYRVATIPGGMYRGTDSDTQTFGVGAIHY